MELFISCLELNSCSITLALFELLADEIFHKSHWLPPTKSPCSVFFNNPSLDSILDHSHHHRDSELFSHGPIILTRPPCPSLFSIPNFAQPGSVGYSLPQRHPLLTACDPGLMVFTWARPPPPPGHEAQPLPSFCHKDLVPLSDPMTSFITWVADGPEF